MSLGFGNRKKGPSSQSRQTQLLLMQTNHQIKNNYCTLLTFIIRNLSAINLVSANNCWNFPRYPKIVETLLSGEKILYTISQHTYLVYYDMHLISSLPSLTNCFLMST